MLANLQMYLLTDLIFLIFIIIGFVAIGAKGLLDWQSQRDDIIRTTAYIQGYRTRGRLQDQYDEGFECARDKYETFDCKRDEDTAVI